MLKKILDQNLFCFHEKFDCWQDAIVAACQPLVQGGICDDQYAQAIIRCVETYGPYIVILEDIAIPHSQEGAVGVNDTAIGFMRVAQPVVFDPNDEEKNARLFFTIASVDHDKHLQNMADLSELLVNEELIQALLNAQSKEDLMAVVLQ